MTGDGDDLSEREREVLRLLAAGHTAKSAAAELDLSVHTVNDYLREARRKLGVGSSRQAARTFVESETATPQKFASKEVGIAGAVNFEQDSVPDPQPGKRGIPPAWFLAGALMFTTVLTITAMITSQPIPPSGATPTAAVSQTDKASETDARNWIALIDSGQYERSWQAAGKTFREAVSAQTWSKQVEPVRRPLGKVTRRALLSVNAHSVLPGVPNGDYRILRFATDYENAPAAIETIVMESDGVSWRVIGYFIQ